jgi:Tfp pilus assembly protein PilF
MQQVSKLRVMPFILMLTLSCSCTARPRLAAGFGKQRIDEKLTASLVVDGVAAMNRGDSAEAKMLFRRALTGDPNNLTARTYLGILADNAGELEEAEQQFAAAARVAPNSPQARNNYGAILLKLGRERQAAAEFEASLRLDGNQPGALVNLAQIRFASGTSEGLRAARDLFRRARALAPDAEIARALVVISLRLHEPAQAASDYQDYLARVEGAAEKVGAPIARAELGAALFEQGLAKEAAQELDASVAADSSNVNNIVLLARAYLAQKDFTSAEHTLESAVVRGAGTAQVYLALGEVYQASGRIDAAIPAMRHAVDLEPKSEAYRFRYAMLLTDSGAPQAAVIRLKEALEEFPKSSKLWFAMGLAQFQDNKSDAAAEAFEHCLQLDPGLASAYAYLGMIDVDLGKIHEAVNFYKKALAAGEESAVTHYLMSEALGKLVPPDDAGTERHLRRALALDPGFQQARLGLGKLFLHANRFEDAARELEGVIQADPKIAEAYYQLGRAYSRLKRKEEAQATMAKFEQLSAEEKEQSERERRELVRRLADVRF